MLPHQETSDGASAINNNNRAPPTGPYWPSPSSRAAQHRPGGRAPFSLALATQLRGEAEAALRGEAEPADVDDGMPALITVDSEEWMLDELEFLVRTEGPGPLQQGRHGRVVPRQLPAEAAQLAHLSGSSDRQASRGWAKPSLLTVWRPLPAPPLPSRETCTRRSSRGPGGGSAPTAARSQPACRPAPRPPAAPAGCATTTHSHSHWAAPPSCATGPHSRSASVRPAAAAAALFPTTYKV